MHFSPIAHIRTPFRQKFAIPRQASLVPEAIGSIEFLPAFSDPNSLRAIEQFSHLWLIFHFHQTAEAGWSPLVQPPRLGGRQKVGVFASRATHRPNSLGMSVVRFLDWSQQGSSLTLRVAGVDLLDGTPLLDIKPYLPYADCLPEAHGGYAQSVPGEDLPIHFSMEARNVLDLLADDYPQLEKLICTVLRQDPRPAWRQKAADSKCYGMSLYDTNIKWRHHGDWLEVLSILPDNSGPYLSKK